MPIYCYKTEDNLVVDRTFPAGQAPENIVLPSGEIITRDYQAEARGMLCTVKGSTSPRKQTWPMTCYASGVHPSQAGELRQHLRERGCPTEVTKGGDPIYNSPAHRKKALKVRGMHDRNSFT